MATRDFPVKLGYTIRIQETYRVVCPHCGPLDALDEQWSRAIERYCDHAKHVHREEFTVPYPLEVIRDDGQA